jgi:hypothetical protein
VTRNVKVADLSTPGFDDFEPARLLRARTVRSTIMHSTSRLGAKLRCAYSLLPGPGHAGCAASIHFDANRGFRVLMKARTASRRSAVRSAEIMGCLAMQRHDATRNRGGRGLNFVHALDGPKEAEVTVGQIGHVIGWIVAFSA